MTSKEKLAIVELERLLQQYPQIEFVDAIIPDLNGLMRGKRYPIAEADKVYYSGIQIPESTLLLDYMGESSDPCGRGFSDGDPDGTLMPIIGTTKFMPWGANSQCQVLMRMFSDDGLPCMVDPRNIAGNVVQIFNKLGFNVNIAFEIEFYLIDRMLDDKGRPQLPLQSANGANRGSETQVYLLEDLDLHGEFLRRVHDCCKIQAIPATVITSEYSPSQYEINLNHVSDPLTAADQCVLLKRVISAVATELNLRATFMPKPFIDQSGSGLHIHLSMMDRQGDNIFVGDSPLGNGLMQNAIGGLLDTIPEMFAIFAPNRNSYRRFKPNIYVPVNRSWGYNNRSVAVRVPAGDVNARRLEHRLAGADANPYLLLAAVLAGVHYGITNQINAGKATPHVNASADVDPNLPLEWGKAISVLRQSTFAQNYLTQDYVDLYCEMKQDELARYNEQVTVKEYELYL